MGKSKNNEINSEALNRNIEAIHQVRQKADERRRVDQKFVDHVATFLGSLKNLYLHLFFYGSFVIFLAINKPAEIKSWLDFLFAVTSVAGGEALFLTIFVLINQRRMNGLERINSDLHLQMSLLTEHEITRLVQMTEQIALQVGVSFKKHASDLEEIKKDIHPDQVMQKILQHEAESPTDSTKNST